MEEENRRLRTTLAAQGGLINRHQDAILQDIINQIRTLLSQDPCLREEVAAILRGRPPTTGSLLNGLSQTLSRPVQQDADSESFVLVDPHRNLRVLLHDFQILASSQQVLPALEDKIDLDAILKDLNSGGTSTLYYIGHGIWVTGAAIFQVTYQVLRLTGTALNNPLTRAILMVAIRVLTGG